MAWKKAPWEPTSAFTQPDGTINEVLVKYRTQNAMGDVQRQVETRASKKHSSRKPLHVFNILLRESPIFKGKGAHRDAYLWLPAWGCLCLVDHVTHGPRSSVTPSWGANVVNGGSLTFASLSRATKCVVRKCETLLGDKRAHSSYP